jgi:hypothetical protein
MNPIDNHFKQNLNELEIKPSATLWKEKIAPNIVQSQPKGLVVWYRAAAVIILLLSGYFAVQFFGGDAQNTLQPELPIAVEETPETILPIVIEDENNEELEDAEVIENIAQPKKIRQAKSLQNIAEAPKRVQVIDELSPANSADISIATVQVTISIRQPELLFVDELPTNAEENLNTNEPRTGLVTSIKNSFKKSPIAQKIETETKDLLDFPQVAVRIEGNPLRGILRNNE